MKRTHFIFISLFAVLFMTGIASAVTWTGSAGTNSWSTAGNWDTGSVPTQNDSIAISGSAKVNYDVSGNIERSANTDLTGNVQLTVAGRRFLNGRNAACTFSLADNAALTHSGEYFIIGTGYPAVLNQTGGVITSSTSRGFFVTDSAAAAGSLYNLTGGTLNVTFTEATTDTARCSFPGNGGNGSFYVNGGQANFSVNTAFERRVYMRRDCVLQIDSGSASFTGFRYFSVGRDDAGEAKVILNGGTLTISTRDDGAIVVGGQNAQGRIIINGGVFNIVSANGIWVGDGTGCKRAIVEQTEGTVNVSTDVVLGRVTTAVNTYYQMDGGTLTARDIQKHANADASVKFIFNAGKITLSGDRTALLNETWFEEAVGTVAEYDAVNNRTYISRIPYAHSPVPASGSAEVGSPLSGGTVAVTLGWTTGLSVDPNSNPGQTNSKITKHRLYMSNGSQTDPNQYFLAEIDAGTPVSETASYGPITLAMDKRYYWRVDEFADPNIITGKVWTFTTPYSKALITGITPKDALVGTGQTVQITADYASEASSVTAVTWYLNDTAINPAADSNVSVTFNNTQSTLTISSMAAPYEGLYHCVVTNSGGNSVPSENANIKVKRLVAWYAFENNVTDSANDFDGTAAGEPLYETGLIGQAITLDGIDDAVSIPRTIQDSFTIELWVKTAAIGGTGSWWNGRGLVDGEVSGTVNDFGTVLLGSKFGFGIGNPDTTISSTSDINDNQWHYCVATRDTSTGEMKVYVDGELESTVTGPAGIRDAASILLIGSLQTGSNSLAGQMDEVKLYNYPLDEQTVVQNYYTITGKSVCVYSKRPDAAFDLNGDCIVDVSDLADFATGWLDCGLYPVCN